jgi:hypothetical protein
VREDVLGGDVARRAAERVRLVAVGEDLREAKVAELDVTRLVDEDVLGLEVAVHDVRLVEVLEREHNARDVEARELLVHALRARQRRLDAGSLI